eukprot:6016951-Heterocapsa_arctica.AAC.1
MRGKLNNEKITEMEKLGRKLMGTQEENVYKWIRGKKGNGPFIVSRGGSAQMKDRMKLAEETWGGLWA